MDDRHEILAEMTRCSACEDIGAFSRRDFRSGMERIEFYLRSLPMINYAKDQLVNYVFSNGLVSGETDSNERLNTWLYKKNEQNITNYAVLRNAIGLASVYGECGIRYADGNIYAVKSGTYAPILYTDDGIQKIVGYIVTDDGTFISERKLDLDELGADIRYFDIEEYVRNRHLILLDAENFVNVRNDTSKLFGESPLIREQLRLDLLTSVYERLNYDINYDGIGRIVLRPRDGYITGEENEISTSELTSQTAATSKARNANALREARRVATELKSASSDSVIVLSNAFSDNIEKLERVTKATEFFDWISYEGKIIAEVMGISPSLLEQGELSGNVSMKAIISQAMKNSIVPLRENYATQFSPMIAPKIGLSKIYFGKFEDDSVESKNSARLKVATTMQQLNTIEGIPEIQDVIRSFAQMLDYDIHGAENGVVELSLDRQEENNEQIRNFEKGGRSSAASSKRRH